MKRTALTVLIILFLHDISSGQSIIFNDGTDIYEIVDGTCNYVKFNQVPPIPGPSHTLFSIARYKDTIYVLNVGNAIYRTTINTPATFTYIATIPMSFSSPSFCADKHGMLYGISDKTLYRFDPHTARLDIFGDVPEQPGGDMVFYKDTLLYAATTGIIAVNMQDPPASQLFMAVPNYGLWGLVVLPLDCNHNKLYGVGYGNGKSFPDLIELDPETRTVIGPECSIPYAVLDAASTVEDGTTLGITIDSIGRQSPCGNATLGGVHIFAYTAAKGALTYTVDGNITNTTGVFDDLPLGGHTLHITNALGCLKDSAFTITQGLSTVFNTSSANPSDCYHLDGSIDVQASTGTPPLQYSLNDGPPQPTPHFDNLGAGDYHLKVIDDGHCEKDTILSLHYIHPVGFLDHVTVTPSVCTSKNGMLSVTLAPGIDPNTIQLLLNGAPQSSLDVTGLDAGFYTMSIINSAACRYDTSIQILSAGNEEPAILATVTDPICLPDNGNVSLSVSGLAAPYETSMDNAAFSNELNYPGLAAGLHAFSVKDKDGCSWDSSIVLHPYTPESVTVSVDSANPNCRQLNSGWIKIRVQGSRPPYLLLHDGRAYNNGNIFSGLSNGRLSFPVINADGCTIDSVITTLQLQMLPGCDTFYMPDGFTPNGDGNNDVFRPIYSPYLTNYQLEIYDRWGEQVYVDKDVIKGWNGTHNGHPLPAGSYVWMIRYVNFENQRRFLKGVVFLVR